MLAHFYNIFPHIVLDKSTCSVYSVLEIELTVDNLVNNENSTSLGACPSPLPSPG